MYEVSVNLLSLVFRVLLGGQSFTASFGPGFSFPNKEMPFYRNKQKKNLKECYFNLSNKSHKQSSRGFCLPPLHRNSGISPGCKAWTLVINTYWKSCSPAFTLTLLSCSYCPRSVMFFFKDIIQQVIHLFGIHLFGILYRVHIPLELASMVDM